jgi:N-acetylmuramoyl-L-alanine amidase
VAPTRAGPVIVLDAAHGGTDTGARGANLVEKDVVLQFALAVRTELERQGFRVLMTRTDDSGPSYDDRVAIANTNRDAIFITFHVASNGTFGVARAYYYRFATPPSAFAPLAAVGADLQKQLPPSAPLPPALAPPAGLVLWEEAQRPYVELSHRLADSLQGELAQAFSGSPVTSTAAAVRDLRSVAAPAVAVEISSVAVSDPNSLAAMAAPLATSIVRGIVAFGPAGSTGAK